MSSLPSQVCSDVQRQATCSYYVDTDPSSGRPADPDGKPALTVTDDTVWLVWRGEGGYLRLATAAL